MPLGIVCNNWKLWKGTEQWGGYWGSGALRPRCWRDNGEVWIHVTRLLTTPRPVAVKSDARPKTQHNTTQQKRSRTFSTWPFRTHVPSCVTTGQPSCGPHAWSPRHRSGYYLGVGRGVSGLSRHGSVLRGAHSPHASSSPPQFFYQRQLLPLGAHALIRVCYAKPRIRLASLPRVRTRCRNYRIRTMPWTR